VPSAPVPPVLPPQHGFVLLDQAKFTASFAGDLSPRQATVTATVTTTVTATVTATYTAAFMAASQVPWGMDALQGEVSTTP